MVIASVHAFTHSQGCQEEGLQNEFVVAVVRAKPGPTRVRRCVVRLFTMRIARRFTT